MNLKKLFHRHEYVEIPFKVAHIFLGITREKTSYRVLGLPVYCNYYNYNSILKCKCGKKKYIKRKFMTDAESASVLY